MNDENPIFSSATFMTNTQKPIPSSSFVRECPNCHDLLQSVDMVCPFCGQPTNTQDSLVYGGTQLNTANAFLQPSHQPSSHFAFNDLPFEQPAPSALWLSLPTDFMANMDTSDPAQSQLLNHGSAPWSTGVNAAWSNASLTSDGFPSMAMTSNDTDIANVGLPYEMNDATTPVLQQPQQYGMASGSLNSAAPVIQSSAWVHEPPVTFPLPPALPIATTALHSVTSGNPIEGEIVRKPGANIPSTSPLNLSGSYDHINRPTKRLPSRLRAQDHKANLRGNFLKHGAQMGVRHTEAKAVALAKGDLSGDDIHPIFVHIAHLYGAMLKNRAPSAPPRSLYPEEEATYLFVVLDILRSPSFQIVNPFYRLRAHGLFALYFYYKQDIPPARDQMEIAKNLIECEDLHFDTNLKPSTYMYVAVGQWKNGGRVEDLTMMAAPDEEDEQRSILAHMLYIDRCAEALLRVEPQVPVRLDAEFMALMGAEQPPLDPTNSIYMRTSCILLLFKSQQMVDRWPSPALGQVPFLAFYRQYHDLVAQILKQLMNVELHLSLMIHFFCSLDNIITYKCCIIVLRTALINMYTLIERNASRPDAQHKAMNEAVHIAGMSDSFKEADYEILDPILSLCWNTAKNVLLYEQRQIQLLVPDYPHHDTPNPLVGVYAEHIPMTITKLRMYTRMLTSTVPYVEEDVEDEISQAEPARAMDVGMAA